MDGIWTVKARLCSCVCVSPGTQVFALVMTTSAHVITLASASCGRNEVQRLERCCGAPRAYLSPASGERKRSRVLQLSENVLERAGTHSAINRLETFPHAGPEKKGLRYQTHPCSSLRETETFRLCPSVCRAVRISAHCTISPRGPPFRTLGLKTSPDSSVKNPT